LKELREKIKKQWAEVPVKYKKTFIISGLVIAVIAVGTLKSNVDHQKKEEAKKDDVQEVPLSTDALQKSYFISAQEEAAKRDMRMNELTESLTDLSRKLKALQSDQNAEKKARLEEKRGQTAQNKLNNKGFNNLPLNNQSQGVTGPPPLKPTRPVFKNQRDTFQQVAKNPLARSSQKTIHHAQERGGITVISNPEKGKEGKKNEDESIKKKNRFLLPPSFMEATLLSGLDAPTSEGGKAHPVPMFFRVKAPAVLPNEVRANLKGCFIVGEGSGRLDTERVDVRLVNISCVDVRGNGIIVSPLNGYIVDADSKIGLHGRVVTKMGSVLLRHLLAGIMGGVAEAAKSAGTTYSTTEFGIPTANVKSDVTEALKSGLGSGMSGSFKKLQDFYLDLAKQMMPVIEVGALKEVVAVISKETSLEIRELDEWSDR